LQESSYWYRNEGLDLELI